MKYVLGLFVLFLVQFSGFAHAAPETYAATVDDGTAKVIGPVGTESKAATSAPKPSTAINSTLPKNKDLDIQNNDVMLDDLKADRKESVAQAEKARAAAPKDSEDKRLDSAQVERTAQSKELRKENRFDIVPDARVSEMSDRLKYTNDILKRFGRAYDYRATTLKEFKKILAELEKQSETDKQN